MECPECKESDLYGVVKCETILVYTDSEGNPTDEAIESIKALVRDCPVSVECTSCGYVHNEEATLAD